MGPVRTALVALVAFLLAAGLAASYGYLGWLAALGLVLFTLPALMVIEASRDEAEDSVLDHPPAAASTAPDAPHPSSTIAASLAVVAAARSERAARLATAGARAWAEFPPLALLVGAWLLVLVLQHRSITTYDPWTVAIVVPGALVGYAVANLLAIRIATRRRRVRTPPAAADSPMASLTIVVPTRDDIETLPGSLASLRAQTYPDTTILVVDDASTDGSPDEAGAWIGADAVVTAPPRPHGWSSHAWACRVGADLATTDLILFADPDTVLSPIAARVLVEQIETRRGDLLVGMSRAAMPTVGERAAVPGFALLRYGFVPIWWAALVGGRLPPLAGGDGSLVMVRREAYQAVGGHSEARPGVRPGSVLTDAFARADRRMSVVRVATLAATRRYRDAPAAVTGWRRRIMADGAGTLAGAIAIVAVVATAFLVPVLLPAVAILSRVDADLVAAACIPLLILLVLRLLLAISDRQSPGAIVWHPVTVLLAVIGQGLGIADHVAGRDSDEPGDVATGPIASGS